MREILFRGKCIRTGKWVQGDLLQFQDGTIIHSIENGCRVSYDIDYKSIGEYTGINDKNGKKIFEGDIVCAPINELDLRVSFSFKESDIAGLKSVNGKVVFDNGFFIIEWEGDVFEDGIISMVDGLEVIGNIYDNPELLTSSVE